VFVGQVPSGQAVVNSWDCSNNQTREGALRFHHCFFFTVEVRHNLSPHVFFRPFAGSGFYRHFEGKVQDLDPILSPADGSLHSSQCKARQKRGLFFISASLFLSHSPKSVQSVEAGVFSAAQFLYCGSLTCQTHHCRPRALIPIDINGQCSWWELGKQKKPTTFFMMRLVIRVALNYV